MYEDNRYPAFLEFRYTAAQPQARIQRRRFAVGRPARIFTTLDP